MPKMRSRSWILVLAAALGLAATLSGCLEPASPSPSVVSVTISPGDVTLQVGTSRQLTVDVQVTLSADKTVTWSSSDATIATVADGLVTANAAGKTKITAKSTVDDSKSDSIEVTVTTQPVTPPSIGNLTATNAMGSTVDLAWTASDATSFDVYAVLDSDSNDEQLIKPGVTGTSVNVAMPASNRQTIRVVANGPGGTDSADVALHFVVVSSGDYDPYTLQPGIAAGRWPQPPVQGTLRYLLDEAQSGQIIGFASDIASIDVAGVDVVPVNSVYVDAHLILRKDVTISAPDSGVTLKGVSAAPDGTSSEDAFTWESRMIFVMSGVTATLDHLTIQGGTFIYYGAGIRNAGALTVSNSTITGNRAWERGGGIWNEPGATLTLTDSHVNDNRSVVPNDEYQATFAIRGGSTIHVSDGGDGGALYNEAGGSVTATDTTFNGNEAKYSGGAIYNSGTAVLDGSPIESNDASAGPYTYPPGDPTSPYSWGGGAYNQGTFTFSNADFLSNTSANVGGGFALQRTGTATLDTVYFDKNAADFGGGYYQEYCLGTSPGDSLTLDSVTYGVNTAAAYPDAAEDPVVCTPIIAPLAGPTAPSQTYPDDPAKLR